MVRQVYSSGRAAGPLRGAKHMKKYRVTFEVVQTQLDVIAGLLSNDVTNMHIEEIGKIVNGRRSHDWTLMPAKFVLAAMATGKEYFYKDAALAKAMKDAGLAPSSISGLLSALVDSGKLKRSRRGHYIKA